MKDSDSFADGKFSKYICMTCGFIYDEEKGDPSNGIAPGTRFEDLSEEWVCSMCGDPKSEFTRMTGKETATSIADPGVQGDANQTIVIGSGIAGWAVIEELRKSGHQGRITLVTQGRADYYYKPALSASSSKGLSSEELVMYGAAKKSAELGVALVEHSRVIGIDRTKKKIITDNGLYAYNHLIVATGSKAKVPALFRVKNVYSINSLDDYEKLHSKLPEVKHLAIVGGGLIGCEMADDISKTGVKITVINRASHLLESVVPEPLAQGLQSALASNGVAIRNNEEITEVGEKEEGGTLQLSLASGDSMEVEALLLCAGTVASYRFCRLAGIESGAYGIVVDNHMRTSDPSIYALGDCVECEGQSLKFVEPIINQAKVIAHHVTSDDVSIQYQPERILIKVKTPSYPICVYKHRLSTPVENWTLIKSDEDGIFAELFCDNRSIGCALSGKYVKEMQADLKTSYIKRNNPTADFPTQSLSASSLEGVQHVG